VVVHVVGRVACSELFVDFLEVSDHLRFFPGVFVKLYDCDED
jgi:hypothetical protein